MLGEDSQHGSIVHEMSHFLDIGGTVDKDRSGYLTYGVPGAKGIIAHDPQWALKHADTFEYYVERAF